VQKFKVSGQSVPTIVWKQMGRQTDGGDCIISHTSVVGEYHAVNISVECTLTLQCTDSADNMM